MPRLIAVAALLFAFFALPACGGGDADDGVITGKVYFEGGKVDLPEGVFIMVRLLGPRQTDGRTPILGEHMFENADSLPVEFRIAYDESLVDESEEYTLIAAVMGYTGGVHYLSDYAPVLTGGHPFDRDIEVYEFGRPK